MTSRKANEPVVILSLFLSVVVLFISYTLSSEYKVFLLGFIGLMSMVFGLAFVFLTTSSPYSSLGLFYVGLTAIVHGLGWILASIFEEQHYSRRLASSEETYALGLAAAGIGLLSFAIGYSSYYMFKRRFGNSHIFYSSSSAKKALSLVSWKTLGTWLIAVLVFEASGGMGVFGKAFGTVNYIYRALFFYVAALTVILFSLKLLSETQNAKRGFAVTLLVVGVYVLLIASRQVVVPLILTIIILAAKWQLVPVRSSYIVGSVIFGLLTIFLLSLARATFGRSALTHTTLREQIEVMMSPLEQSPVPLRETLEYDLGYRLNASNVLVGLIIQRGGTGIWLEPYTYSIIKLVPGIFWPSKSYALSAGELPRLISDRYQLPPTDYISTYISTFYATGGSVLLILSMGLFGAIIAFFDEKLFRCSNLWCSIFAVGFCYGVLQFDHSIDLLFISIRDSVVLYIVLKILPRIGFSQNKVPTRYTHSQERDVAESA